MTNVVEVAVPGPFTEGLDYKLTEQTQNILGRRVTVSLGRREVTGVIINIKSESKYDPAKLKSIGPLLDPVPLYSNILLDLITWVSKYYHHPIGDTFQTAMLGALAGGADLNPESEILWQTTDTGQALDLNELNRAAKQRAALEYLQHASADKTTLAKLDITSATLKALEKKELVKQVSQIIDLKASPQTDSAKALNDEQQVALDASIQAGDNFSVQLLEGVTGSGKTEVYLQRIAKVIEQGKQVLVLVPEIGLTPQTIERFTARFETPVVTLHSNLNDRERRLAIYHAKNGQAKIIIGTRSAIFVPTENLGMIVVDEEHDLSFKQQSGLRYHARDVAIKRAHLADIPIILGSATPSLETLHNATDGKFIHLKLSKRAANALMPTYHLINLKQQKLNGGLSRPLIDAIKTHVANNSQVLIFINRRGFAPVLMCHDCGWMHKCERCDRPYTLHTNPSRLICHHCTSTKPIIHKCPECDTENPLGDVGTGTEKVEMTLKEIFPDKNVIRIDRSNVSKKGEMDEKLQEIHDGKADILVGTQMLAKGHHFKNLTMVGIVNVDDALFSNDFRATEHLGQMITQVSGRAGRSEKQGEVYLQTAHTDHPLLNVLLKKDFAKYSEVLLEERQATCFPPYAHLAALRAEAHDARLSFEALNACKTELANYPNIEVNCFGPIPAFLAKRAGFFRAQLILHADSRKGIHQALSQISHFLKLNPQKKVRLTFDVDPQEMS